MLAREGSRPDLGLPGSGPTLLLVQRCGDPLIQAPLKVCDSEGVRPGDTANGPVRGTDGEVSDLLSR